MIGPDYRYVTPNGQPAFAPEDETPCCRYCGADVAEVSEGMFKGLYECTDVVRQACDGFFRFDELAWRA